MSNEDDFDLNIPIYPMKLNLYLDEGRKAAQIFLSTYMGSSVKDINDLGSFMSYSYPNCIDKERVIEMAKYSVFYFLMDDFTESHIKELGSVWKYVFYYHKSLTENPIEKMYENLFDRMKKHLSPQQIRRFTHSNINFLRVLELPEYVYENMPIKEFLNLRYLSAAGDQWIVLMEYMFNTPLDDYVMEHILFKKFDALIVYYGVIQNDIYSYKKEMFYETNQKNQMNYVSHIMKLHKCTHKFAVKFTLKELKINESKTIAIKEQIIANKLNFPIELLNDYFFSVRGSTYWHTLSKRY